MLLIKDLPASHAAAKRQIVTAIKEVAHQRKQHTAAVCKKCYIHPAILEAFESQSLTPVLRECFPRIGTARPSSKHLQKRIIARARRALRVRC